MNKKLLILGIAILLICVGLSGCEEQKEAEKTENAAPIVFMFNAYPTTGIAPLNVSFMGYGLDLDGDIVSYIWDFDDGEYSTEENPKHTFETIGTYSVTFTVTDDKGATDFEVIEIIVEEKQNSETDSYL